MVPALRVLHERVAIQLLAPTLASGIGGQIANFAARPAPEGSNVFDSKAKVLLKLLEPGSPVTEVMSPEDKAAWDARAKDYSRRRMQAHRQWQKGLTTRLKLKQAAIRALPTEFLRAEALREDHLPFPMNRQIFTDTPPIVRDDQASPHEASKPKLGTKRR